MTSSALCQTASSRSPEHPLPYGFVPLKVVHVEELTGWKRLADAIVRRRIALGYDRRQKDFARHAGLSDKTLQYLENAKKEDEYRPGTFVALEKALLWAPGSAQAVVGGHDPVEYPIPEPEPSPEQTLAQIDDAELVARLSELTAEVARRLSRRPERKDPAGMPTVGPSDPVPWESNGQAGEGLA